jgi:hypothetical protein
MLKMQNDKTDNIYCSNETKLKGCVVDHYLTDLTGQCREQFRGWALKKGLCLDVIYSSHGEPFADKDTQTCWEIWLASRAAINRI